MLVGLGVEVALGEAEIDDVDDLGLFASADHEVVGLDISMHESLAVDLLQPRDDLDADVQRGRQGESFLAEWRGRVPDLEEVFQRLAEELDDHEDAIVVRVGSKIVEPRDAS